VEEIFLLISFLLMVEIKGDLFENYFQQKHFLIIEKKILLLPEIKKIFSF
jgi:hypothetical protein